jgi:hypothetical protein
MTDVFHLFNIPLLYVLVTRCEHDLSSLFLNKTPVLFHMYNWHDHVTEVGTGRAFRTNGSGKE